MRVIAGRARGRRLIAPQRLRRRRGSSVRPTSDLVRGAIFSVLASLQADMSRVLDLYAGSGALGIEALSRGGDWCDFIERDRAICETIGENLRLTGFEAQARVYSLPAKRAVEELHGPYALVLADPPYEDETALGVLESLAEKRLAQEGKTVLVLEHSARKDAPGEIGGLALVNARRHGDSAISIYR